ncbi:putative ATP-dependent RNA helicase DDX56 [Nymphon striatum]|nr:putative ATP-dependent RNA helicase DDX56 [Nymphon striatum]
MSDTTCSDDENTEKKIQFHEMGLDARLLKVCRNMPGFDPVKFMLAPSINQFNALLRPQLIDLAIHLKIDVHLKIKKAEVKQSISNRFIALNIFTAEELSVPPPLDNSFALQNKMKELELKVQELELREREALLPKESLPSIPYFDIAKHIRLVPRFDEKHIDNFFLHFEKIAKDVGWKPEHYTLLIQSVLTGKAAAAYLALPSSSNYIEVKEAILKAYLKVPEAYRVKFREFSKLSEMNFIEFAKEKELLFNRWCLAEKVKDFQGLKEMILLEEFKNCCTQDIKMYLSDHKNIDLYKAAELADEFSFAHNLTKTSKNVLSFKNRNYRDVEKPKFKPAFKTEGKSSKLCKFCCMEGHSSFMCQKFPSIQNRLLRCTELGLCTCCVSSKHTKVNCPGLAGGLPWKCGICHSSAHIAALCPQFVPRAGFNSFRSNLSIADDVLLPVCNLRIGEGEFKKSFPFLLDTGSQISFMNEDALSGLGFHTGSETKKDIFSVFSKNVLTGKNALLDIVLPSGKTMKLPFFINKQFSFSINISQIEQCISNINNSGLKISPNFPSFSKRHSLKVMGLIGADILQYFDKFHVTPCLRGKALQLYNGLIPFGSVTLFLNAEVLRPDLKLRYNLGEPKSSTVKKAVNFVLAPPSSHFSPLTVVMPDSDVEQGIERLYSLENMGITDSKTEITSTDADILKSFEDSIELRPDGHYYVSLPWKREILDNVPHNYDIAHAVAERVYSKLEKDDNGHLYNEVFLDQLKEGIIEPITGLLHINNHKWIPHRPVYKVDEFSTTKIRPVLNCSLRRGKNPSLNMAAFSGIDLMSNLFDLLIKFRTGRCAVLSDIRKAFLMIRLKNEEDKNRFSFLIKKDGKFYPYRYKTIVFGFISSPFILNFVLKLLGNKEPLDLSSLMLKDYLYVDNLIFSSSNLNATVDACLNIDERLAQAGFQLKGWNSNNHKILSKLRSKDLDISCKEKEKALGYVYSVKDDLLTLANKFLDVNASTKRQILSAFASIFDPLGFLNPLTVGGKILMRELWMNKKTWDEPLELSYLNKYKTLAIDINKILLKLEIPRQAVEPIEDSCIYIFTDASKEAFGCNIYCHSENRSELLFSKVKVSPLKSKTLPTLELLAVLLGLKCVKTVLSNLQNCSIKKIVLFSDAQIVLNWILTDDCKVKGIFIKNRLKDIKFLLQDLAEICPVSFAHVPGTENPADLVTRGVSARVFELRRFSFLHGPNWLKLPPASWPVGELGCIAESVKCKLYSPPTKLSNFSNALIHNKPIIDINNFRSYKQLIKVTTLVFKAINRWRKRSDSLSKNEAKKYLIKLIQCESFSEELNYLHSISNLVKKNAVKKPVLVDRLNLFVDKDGLLRSSGRIDKSLVFTYEIRNPILLPAKGTLTELIVWDSHYSCKHLGVPSTLMHLRNSGWWLPKGRQIIKTIIKGCATCIKFNSLPFRNPPTTSLPSNRVNFLYPFQHTGIDFTGHIWIKDDAGNLEKMYLLIYTCLNVRAVYIDLIPKMDTRQFLLSFMRFVNLYGTPTHLYSDNARTFLKGGELIEQMTESDEFKSSFVNSSIKHLTIPLYSPWVGACWERLIRTIKVCLNKTIGRSKLSYFDMLAVISDIGHVINSRPLTYINSDSNDKLKPLTPNDFIKPYANSSLIFNLDSPPDIFDLNTDENEKNLVSVLEQRDNYYLQFKREWYEHYLLSLREKIGSPSKLSSNNDISAGDVVLIKIPNKTRPYWLLGRVLRIVIGHDNRVRSVFLKRSDGRRAHHSIVHLYPLELKTLSQTSDEENNENTYNVNNDDASNIYNDNDNINNNYFEKDEDLNANNDINESNIDPSDIPNDFVNDECHLDNKDLINPSADVSLRPQRKTAAICKLGWAEPTLIQEKAIPLALGNRDILARARTGSGKTGAFVIPTIQLILNSKQNAKKQEVKALMLAPSRELCKQIYSNIDDLSSCCSQELNCVDVSGQADIASQRPLLKENPDIVVGTPARILMHLQAKNMDLSSSIEILIIDEADLVFSFGHEKDIKAVLEYLPKTYQSIMMSATLTEDVKSLKKILLHSPVILKLEEPHLPQTEQLTQYHIKCEDEDKFVIIYSLLKLKLIRGKSIIFVNSIDRCYKIKLYLEQFAIRSCVLNSELPVSSRCHIVSQFNDGLYDIIIASDEKTLDVPEQTKKPRRSRRSKKLLKSDKEYGVSRGIDFQFVSNVIILIFQTLLIHTYTELVGKTARGNNKGTALSFVNMKELGINGKKTASTSIFKPFLFRMDEISGFKYRAQDALRAVTRIAIREARLKEIKNEIFNSQKLKTYFEDNPRELKILRHDKTLHTVKIQPHLKDVPDYIVPSTLKKMVNMGQKKKKRKITDDAPPPSTAAQRKYMRKKQNPLKSFEFEGFGEEDDKE